MTIKNIEDLRSNITKHLTDNRSKHPNYIAIGFGHNTNSLSSRYGIRHKDLYCIVWGNGRMQGDKVGHSNDVMYFVTDQFYNEHIKENKLMTLAEQVTKAQALIGKTVKGELGNSFEVESFRLINKQFDVPIFLVGKDEDLLEEKGFLVILESQSEYVSVDSYEEVSNVVTLNSEYTATIEGEIVRVGCQRIPIAKVKEILDAYNNLKAKS